MTAGTVTKIQSSIPEEITLTCTNSVDGVPAQNSPDWNAYRAQVISAGMVTSVGTPEFLQSVLKKVVGVKDNLISYKMIAPQT